MPMIPPDRTINTRASAKLCDAQRLQSIREQSPEEKLAKDGAEARSTVNMAIVAVIGIVIFVLFWWLVVH